MKRKKFLLSNPYFIHLILLYTTITDDNNKIIKVVQVQKRLSKIEILPTPLKLLFATILLQFLEMFQKKCFKCFTSKVCSPFLVICPSVPETLLL